MTDEPIHDAQGTRGDAQGTPSDAQGTPIAPGDEQAEERADAWQEVGEQFRLLGQSLAQAIRATWHSDETQARLRSVRAGVEEMADEIGDAVKEAIAVPEAEEVRQRVRRAAESTVTAGQQALDEARPHLLTALRQINAELQCLIERMERGRQEEEEQLVGKIEVKGPEEPPEEGGGPGDDSMPPPPYSPPQPGPADEGAPPLLGSAGPTASSGHMLAPGASGPGVSPVSRMQAPRRRWQFWLQ